MRSKYSYSILAVIVIAGIFLIAAAAINNTPSNSTLDSSDTPIAKIGEFFKELYDIVFGKKSITGNAIGSESTGYTLGFLVLVIVLVILYIIVRRKSKGFKQQKAATKNMPKKTKKKKR
ncbi:MAG: hypothetical protein ABIE22_00105 [archaeon]